MSDFTLQGLGISAEEFLSSMFAPHEIVRLRVFSDRSDTDFTGQKLEVEQAKFSNIIDTLHRHNAENRGVFFAVNHGGHTDAEIDRINAQFAEIDNLSLEEQLAKIKDFPLPPSLVIKTRKSLHCYWLMKNAEVGRFRHIQRQLVAHFGADPACVNESRVLRLPEFNHCKQEPIMVECIKFNPELRYTQEQLSEQLPSVPEEVTAATKSAHSTKAGMQGVQKGLILIGRNCDFFKYCKRNAKSLPEPQWHAMITNLAVFEGGVEAIHSISKPYPDYTFEATQKKIETFYKSGTRPMTCQAIAERGYKCPKLDSCGGKCKSPAGLAFFAMDISEIRKWLEKTKTATNTLDNVVIARQFINDYAYNIDTGLAHALITSEIKTKFAFKANDLEPLIAFHKDIYKAFLETHQVKFDRAGDELPQWYEFTDKGRIRFMPSVLANYCVEHEKVFYCGDNYYFYQNGVYVQRDDMAAQQRIRHHMAIDKHKTYAQINDAERQWRIEICKTVREINVNHYIMNFKNGLYYVHADELKEHNPDVLSTIQLNANYGGSEKANCPVFLKYLDDVLPKTEHDLVQEMLGYIMIAVSKAQKAFLLVGKKDSGKSTMLYLINTLLGEDNYSTLTWQNLDERFTTFQLFGKLANVFADLPSQALRDTGNFKAITGEDCIMIESKHKNGFSYKPFCTLVFSCNKIPRNYNDRSDAFFGRLILLRFGNTIPVEKQDRGLKEKLLGEIDSIMAWSLIGLKRLMANNWVFSETERTDAEIKQYMTESSAVMTFVEEFCVLDEKAHYPREDLFNVFKEHNPSSKTSQIAFNGELEERYNVKRVSISNRKSWRGIRLA